MGGGEHVFPARSVKVRPFFSAKLQSSVKMPGSEQPPTLNNKLLHKIIHGALPYNEGHQDCSSVRETLHSGKRQLETNRACPQIWTQNVTDPSEAPEEAVVVSRTAEDLVDAHHNNEMVQRIADWLYQVQCHGFPPAVMQKYLRPEVTEDEEDDTWWQEGLTRVFLPYYDIDKEDIDKVIEGRLNCHGEPVGRCTVLLVNGDELTGTFRAQRTLAGMASATGSNMEKHGLLFVRGFHRNGVLHGQGSATLAPNALWRDIGREVWLDGIFNDSYMEGPVRGEILISA